MPAPFGRSSLLGTLAVYAALALGVSATSRALTCARGPGDAPGAVPPELTAFLGPVAPGMSLGSWTIEHVGPLRDGGLRLVLRPAQGAPLILELTRLTPDGPRPLASTGALAVYSVGPGSSSTPPEQLALAAALARAVAAREALLAPPLALLSR